MTRITLFLASLVLFSMPFCAQTADVKAKPLTDSDINLLRQDLQSAKDQIIADTMQFTTAEKAAFWPIYKEYSSEQHDLANKRLRLITEYAQALDKMDDATANSLTERMFSLEDEHQALRRKYYPRFLKALGAKRTAKLYQVDNRLTTMTNVQLASAIPLIP